MGKKWGIGGTSGKRNWITTMNNYQLITPVSKYSSTDNQWWLCPQSSLPLDVEYANSSLLLPLKTKPTLTLGEGNTPLLKLNNLSKQLSFALWAKCEFTNPTGSFKDRGSVVEICKAIELKKKGVVCASTGNMAASLAAYAARAGIACIVVVPKETPENKLRQALICKAKLNKIAGNYDDCVEIAQKIAKEKDFFLCGDYVLRREGQKSIGWELAKSQIVFDGIVVPVGNGTVGIATIKGFAEKTNSLTKLPKLIGVQAKQINPIEKAWNTASEIKTTKKSSTIASAFNVNSPLDGQLFINWLKKTKGMMFAVDDKEIMQAQKILASEEGLFVEPTASATLASLIKNKDQFKQQQLVMILTGSGMKG